MDGNWWCAIVRRDYIATCFTGFSHAQNMGNSVQVEKYLCFLLAKPHCFGHYPKFNTDALIQNCNQIHKAYHWSLFILSAMTIHLWGQQAIFQTFWCRQWISEPRLPLCTSSVVSINRYLLGMQINN